MPFHGLLKHFGRFVIEKEKFEILREKLEVLETDLKNSAQNNV